MLGDGNVKRTFAIYNAKPEWIEKLPSVKSIRLSRENIGACTSLSSMRASFRTGSSKSCYHHVHTGVRGMALLIKNYRPSNSRPVSFNSTEASRTIHQLYPFSFPPSLSLSLSLSPQRYLSSVCASFFYLSPARHSFALSSASLSLQSCTREPLRPPLAEKIAAPPTSKPLQSLYSFHPCVSLGPSRPEETFRGI